MPSNPVGRDKETALAARMRRLGVRESDLKESFIRSGGKGGQNVNKVATCVRIKHLPSGIEVRCQKERSQALNRFLARRRLLDKIENKIVGRVSAAQAKIAKLRRQKRRRSRRAKEKMLSAKHIKAEKKRQRGRPQPDE
jgi:protein subunit release factor B